MADRADFKVLKRYIKGTKEVLEDFVRLYQNDTRDITELEHRINKKFIDYEAEIKKLRDDHKQMKQAIYSFQDDTADKVSKAAKDAIAPVEAKQEKLLSSKNKVIHYLQTPPIDLGRYKMIALVIFGIITGSIVMYFVRG